VPPSLPTRAGFARAHDNHGHRPIHADLEAAWLVQRNLFPREMPAVPGWDFAALCQPARAVAGDYYDLFEFAPGRLALALGDVSGKGLGPAFVWPACDPWSAACCLCGRLT
jgi:serine phosphatase RsbU (regulator of sigma subunit)